eukprot:UN02157
MFTLHCYICNKFSFRCFCPKYCHNITFGENIFQIRIFMKKSCQNVDFPFSPNIIVKFRHL